MKDIELIHGDCYEEIKKIPDKSIDLIYIDIPYEFYGTGGGGAFGAKNRQYRGEYVLNRDDRINKLKAESEKFYEKMKTATTKDEYEKYHTERGNILKKIATANIDTGIDYSILDELTRVQKYIYIYMVQQRTDIPLNAVLHRKRV